MKTTSVTRQWRTARKNTGQLLFLCARSTVGFVDECTLRVQVPSEFCGARITQLGWLPLVTF